MLVLSWLLGNCCWLTVCIVVVDLCVLFILCVFVVLCVYFCFTLDAGLLAKSVFGKSCDRPSQHRFFLVSLCPEANAEMVPKIPICHYMLLM